MKFVDILKRKPRQKIDAIKQKQKKKRVGE